MNPMLIKIYQMQLLLQCRFMVLAAQDVNRGLHNNDVTHVFYALQNLLNAGANISKALWGSKARRLPSANRCGTV
jgi:hypothetical protein